MILFLFSQLVCIWQLWQRIKVSQWAALDDMFVIRLSPWPSYCCFFNSSIQLFLWSTFFFFSFLKVNFNSISMETRPESLYNMDATAKEPGWSHGRLSVWHTVEDENNSRWLSFHLPGLINFTPGVAGRLKFFFFMSKTSNVNHCHWFVTYTEIETLAVSTFMDDIVTWTLASSCHCTRHLCQQVNKTYGLIVCACVCVNSIDGSL